MTALEPVCMTASFKSSRALVQKFVIGIGITDNKIAWGFIVSCIFVNVMENRSRWQWFSHSFFCYQNMLPNIAIVFSTRMVWHIEHYVATFVGIAFPFSTMSTEEFGWLSF